MWGKIFSILLLPVLASFVVTISVQLFPLLDLEASLTGLVHERIGESGVRHPLTAVLLNFRGYDTMLEIGVLLVAVMAVWALSEASRSRWKLVEPSSSSPILRVSLAILTPLAILVAGYMVWVGAYRPGGAFQAGAVLGAAWVILIGSGVIPLPLSGTSGVRFALGSGLILFLAVAALPFIAGGTLLEYPREFAGLTILAVESTLSISIGASIGALIAGVARPTQSSGEKAVES